MMFFVLLAVLNLVLALVLQSGKSALAAALSLIEARLLGNVVLSMAIVPFVSVLIWTFFGVYAAYRGQQDRIQRIQRGRIQRVRYTVFAGV